MKQLLAGLMFLPLLTAELSAFQTSSESVNPFNQFMAPQGGVDLYSVTAAFSIPIISLQGYNAADVQVGLSYSSNVTINARSMNKHGATGWVGLGWSMQFGSIKCDHKGTKTHDDDEFYYVAGAGSVNRLLKPNRLKYQYCSTYTHTTLDSINKVIFHESGKCSWFNARRTEKNEKYAFVFDGKIFLHRSGVYQFHVRSDDGCRLYIDDTLIVDYDGTHMFDVEVTGSTGNKAAGYHTIKVEYFQHQTDMALDIEYTPPSESKRRIPVECLRDPDIPAEDLDKKFYVENTPYLKCDPVDFDDDGIYDCWQITGTDGTRMIFGKLSASDTLKSAVRYTFSQNNFVGTVTCGNPGLYPYQWDLRAVINTFGDTVRYYYQKDSSAVATDSFNSASLNLYYTKASYPDSIVNSNGKSLKFVLEEKKSGSLEEPYDPYIYVPEPDGFMEIYESRRLKRIHVYSPEIAAPVKTIEITYNFLNQSRGNLFLKSMLRSIEWRNNIAGTVENHYDFQYYDDSTQADSTGGYNPGYHYGAIKSIEDYHGTLTEYNYSQIEQEEYDSAGYGVHPGYMIKKNSSLRMYRSILHDNDGPLIHGESGILLHGGSYDNGKEYIAVLGGKKHDRLWLYTFDGHNWILDTAFNCRVLHSKVQKTVQAFDNGFLYRKTDIADNDAVIVFRQDGKWHLNNIAVSHDGDHVVDVYLGNDFLVIKGGDGDHDENRIWVYRRHENEWIQDNQYFGYWLYDPHGGDLKVATGDNFFAVALDNTDRACVIRWDGESWIRRELFPDCTCKTTNKERFHEVYAANNYFFLTGGSKNDYIWLYYWSGDSLEKVYNCTLLVPTGYTIKPSLGSDYFVIKGDKKEDAWIVSWDGKDWLKQKLENPPDNEVYVDAFPGQDYVVLRGGDASVYDRFRLYRKTNKNLGTNDSIWVKDIDWVRLEDSLGNEIGDEFTVVAGNNSFAVTTHGKNIPEKKEGKNGIGNIYRWIYRYNGSLWEAAYQLIVNGARHHSNPRVCATNGGYGFSIMTYVIDHSCDKHNNGNYAENIDIEFVHKFQDNFNTIKSYVVDSKKVISQSTAETLTTTFEYDTSTSYFDAYTGSLKFHKVSVITPGNGKTTTYFYNDGEFYIARPDYKELDGISYKTESFDEQGRLISSQISYHKLYSKTHWPSDIHEKRSDTTISSRNGVHDTTTTLEYKYGTPSKTAKILSTKPTIVNRTIFAHEIDTAMKSRYMLNQQYQTYTYEKAKGADPESLSSDDIRSSQVTLWRKEPRYDFFAPCSSFVWNAVCDNSGRPVPGQFTDFNYNDPGSSLGSHWDYTGSVTKYGKHGIPLEKENNSGKKSSIVTGTARKIPVGSADNSSYQEFAVFTGDYKTGNSVNWWDSLNGWRKYNTATLVNDSTHFGQRAVRFTQSYAVKRDNYIIPGKSYIMSAWVKVSTGTVILKTDFHHSTTDDRDAWPVRTLQLADSLGTISDSLRASDCQGKWKLLKIKIPSSLTSRMNPAYDWYARAWIGAKSGSVVAYLDEVRFYPEGAHVTTTYYDTLYYQPVLTVDENNNPGMRAVYDLQGRPVDWYRIEKSRPDQKTLVMRKEYHLYGE